VSLPTLDPHQPERRKTRLDRRLRATPILSRFWLLGRRKHAGRGRRSSDRQDEVYVDRYSNYEWGLAVSVVLLSLADLALTLTYLSLGGEERNPIMAAFLEHSEASFIAVKFGVTVLGALFLLVHVKFRRVRKALIGLVIAYVGLIVYHLVTWVPAVLKGV
jgi:hypothetical protein